MTVRERYWHGEKAFEQDAQSMIDTLKIITDETTYIYDASRSLIPVAYAARQYGEWCDNPC